MKVWRVLWRGALVVIVLAVASVGLLLLARERGWREPPLSGGAPTVRLITAEQYVTAIHDLFGEDIKVEVSFPPLQRRQGLVSLGASNAIMTPGALEQFDRTAWSVATQVIDEAHRSTLIPCVPKQVDAADAACARQFLTPVGRALYRRAVTEAELMRAVATAEAAAQELHDFYAGLAYSVAGMLTSPKFLYFIEETEPDPDHPGQARLTAYSKASRLSLLLWDAPPDEALLHSAETGELHKPQELEHQIERLIASSRVVQGVRAFFSDLLTFDKFDTLTKDPVIYPKFSHAVVNSAKEQALQLITDQLLTRQGDYRDLYTTSHTFLDGTLGAFYRAKVSSPESWTPYDTDPRYSAGLLTSLGFVAVHAHPGRSSPTRRGKAIRELLLCQKVPDPPPNVNFTQFEDPRNQLKTARERLQRHSTDAVCAGCHKLTDPIGLALENFDGGGMMRLKENGAPIDTKGTLDGEPFNDVSGLGKAMHDHPGLTPCLTSRWFAYAVGREVKASDQPWLSYLDKRFAVHGYRVPNLLREMAQSRAFLAVSKTSSSEPTASPSGLTAANLQ